MRTLCATVLGLTMAAAAVGTASGASPRSGETTYHLSDKGGLVWVAARVKDAKTCIWSSTPKVAGFDKTIKCGTGKLARSAKIGANGSTHSKSWQLSLVIHGTGKATSQHWKIDEAGKVVPAPGVSFGCTGNAPSGISITYGDETSNYSASNLPFQAHLPLGNSQDYYAVTAQLQGSGSVKCHTTVMWRDSGGLHSATQRGSAAGSYNLASAEVCNETELGDGWQAC
jgi:hypothetical protein